MKKNKLIIFILVVCLAPIFPVLYAHAGTRVWGPQKFVRGKGAPVTQFANFTTNPKGEFWIDIANGGGVQKPGAEPGIMEPVGRVSSAFVMLNNTSIAGPSDFNQKSLGVQKDISLKAQNKIAVTLDGAPGSYITIQIMRKTEENLNSGFHNTADDLSASHMFRTEIDLMWDPYDKAAQYILYRAYSQDGPWTELGSLYKGEPTNDIVDITPDAATRDLYYKVDALDDNGHVIKHYEPVYVPKYRTLEDVQ